jgi:hypothetical protein
VTKPASARSASRFVPWNVRDSHTFLPISGSRPAYTQSTHSPEGLRYMLPTVALHGISYGQRELKREVIRM